MGVPKSLNHLLRRVARAVVCFLKHNVVQEDYDPLDVFVVFFMRISWA
jgi:hypothetical protein